MWIFFNEFSTSSLFLPGERFYRFRALSVDHFAMVPATFLFVIQHNGICPMHGSDISPLDRASAIALSLIPSCPGTQVTLLCSSSSPSAINRDESLVVLNFFIKNGKLRLVTCVCDTKMGSNSFCSKNFS